MSEQIRVVVTFDISEKLLNQLPRLLVQQTLCDEAERQRPKLKAELVMIPKTKRLQNGFFP